MESTIDPKALRNIFSSFATGVTIVSYTNMAGVHCGVTVNSFASVSLDPPLLLWNLQKDSECYEDVLKANYYAVNILTSPQSDLSNALARKNQHELVGLNDETLWTVGKYCPVMNNSLACFECCTWQHYEGGDHMILVGKIVRCTRNEGTPLVFFDGNYATLKSN